MTQPAVWHTQPIRRQPARNVKIRTPKQHSQRLRRTRDYGPDFSLTTSMEDLAPIYRSPQLHTPSSNRNIITIDNSILLLHDDSFSLNDNTLQLDSNTVTGSPHSPVESTTVSDNESIVDNTVQSASNDESIKLQVHHIPETQLSDKLDQCDIGESDNDISYSHLDISLQFENADWDHTPQKLDQDDKVETCNDIPYTQQEVSLQPSKTVLKQIPKMQFIKKLEKGDIVDTGNVIPVNEQDVSLKIETTDKDLLDVPGSSLMFKVKENMLPKSPSTEQKLESKVLELFKANQNVKELMMEIENLRDEKRSLQLQLDIQAENFMKVKSTFQVCRPKHPLISETNSKLLFRAGCRLHALSNFFLTTIHYAGRKFKSVEHAFQYLLAMNQNRKDLASTVMRCKTGAQAKHACKGITGNQIWQDTKVELMKELLQCKYRQSLEFRQALDKTGTKTLIHNVENDSFWGCGEDGDGQNILGKLIEELRRCPPLMPSNDEPTLTTNITDDNTPVLLVVSDSMLKNIKPELGADTDNHLACFPGAKIQQIAMKATQLCAQRKVETVVIHAGINNVESDSYHSITKDITEGINNIHKNSPSTNIVLSSLVHRLDKPWLNFRIDAINAFLRTLEDDTVVYAEHNDTFRNLPRILQRDGLHLRVAGVRQIATNIMKARNKSTYPPLSKTISTRL